MANTLNGFKVIGDTSKIGAAFGKQGGGQASSAPASSGNSQTINGFKVVGDTSKIGAKSSVKTTTQKASTPAASTTKPSTSKDQWVSTGGGRKSTTDAGKQQGFVADPTRAKNNAASRIKNIVTGAAKSTGAGYVNTGGVLAEGAGKLNTMIANNNAAGEQMGAIQAIKDYNAMLQSGKWADGKALTAADRQKIQTYIAANQRKIDAHRGYTQAVEKSDKEVADKAYRKADQLAESASKDISQAKQGLGKAGQFAVDVGVAGVQMGGDMALGALTGGSALPSMFVRGVGSAAQEARQSGASYGQQLGYGLGSGALSVATEKISNVAAPFKKAFGAGLADKAAGKLVSKFGESTAVQIMSSLAKRPAGKLALSMISEGGEEFLEDVVQPILQRATYDPSAKFDWSGALYDAAVGAALGGLGSGVEAMQNRKSTQQITQQAPGAQAGVQEGNITPSPASVAEGTQNAAPGMETAVNENGLNAYTEQERVNLSSGKKNKVISTFQDAVSFVRNALSNKQNVDRAYLGKVPDRVAQRILTDTGVDIRGMGAMMNGNDVRHIMKDHGDPLMETARGQVAVTPDDIARIPEVISNPDRVTVSPDADSKGRTALVFEKQLGDKYISIQGVSDGKHVLQTDTLYIRKGKTRTTQDTMPGVQTNTAPVINAQSELPQGFSNLDSNIAQGAENVKNGGSRDILAEILFGKKRADMGTLTAEQQAAVEQANEAGTVGMDAAGKVFQIDPEQHIDRRSMASVGSRDVNAFQFDHPELHRYYQAAAQALIADADLSLQQPMSRRYERTMQGNAVQQEAQTSTHLRQAMNETGLSRDSIIDAAERIVADHGQENVAAAKRVELILDDMLSNGYTTMTGEQVGPNSQYLAAKQGIVGAGEQVRGHGMNDVDIFDTPGDAVAGAVNTDFDAMQAQSDIFHPVNPNSAQRIQAEQRRAPSEVPTVNPETGRNVEKTVSTILNSPLTSPEMAGIYENAIAGGQFDYDVVTDRASVEQAQAKIRRDGYQEVANSFIAKSSLGQRITKADTAEAISAYNIAISEGDHQTAFELANAIAEAAHDSAQVVQAMNLMNRLTPEGRLLTLRRLVDRMNDRAARQNRTPRQSTSTNDGDVESARVDYIDKVTGFTLSDELATNYLMAETDAERAAAWDAITTSIADQIPSTFREKANFWRYTSMLTNPTTHIRNFMGNALQLGARKIKNAVGTAIERVAIRDQSQRTKSVTADKDLKAFARSQYDTDQSAAMGSGKYSDATAAGIEREIQRKRKMFQGEDIFSRAIQGIGDLNSRALDYEDVIFNRGAYVDSFAQALKAKGVTAAEAAAGTRAADVEAARAYAIQEAQKATYRNTTALSEALSQLGRYEGDNPVKRAGSFVADALFPFRKTPANILTTGLDYSPVGLAKGMKEALLDVKSGKCTAADAVDSIASGLTGTGLLVLGGYLAAEGLLHVRAGDDDKEEAFEKATGGQDYAIQIGDKSYSLDWAVPAAMPLFAGAAIMESAQKGGGTFGAVADALLGMQDVVLETSMLSSLNDLIANISYADSPVLYIADKAISSYAGQYIPTVGSKIASALDDTARKSYVEKGTGQLSSDVNYFLQGAAKKVPGVRNQLQPSIDLWGNEVSNGTTPERVFQSFISPGYFKTQDSSPATQEVRRLAKATGESGVYPAAAEKSFTNDGKTYNLTAEEYTQYAKAMGSTRKTLVEDALNLPAYKSMSNGEKAEYVSRVYQYARETARQDVYSDYTPSAKWIENAKTAKRDIGVSTAEYLALYQKYGSEKMSGKAYEKVKLAYQAGIAPDAYFRLKASADTDGNGTVSKAEASAALAGKERRADLWDIICTTNAKNPYK